MLNSHIRNKVIVCLLSIVMILVSCFSVHSPATVLALDESSSSRRAICLNSLERYVYDELATQIKLIANGQRDNAIISIDLTSKINNSQFTAEELGLDSLVGSNDSYTAEANNLALEKALGSFKTDKITYALMYDAPYELYWYDKTLGCSQNLDYSTGGKRDRIGITSVNLVFRFIVSKDYSASGERYTYNLNTSKAESTANALTKAESIVASAKGKSDYDKLVYYKDQICNLASYNHSAAFDPNVRKLYGDPYQLIYVFDGNSSTNVTCEGYSKAFKLLCDLTSFNSPEIACHLVSGTMQGGTGAGPHMWNVVHMDDGHNYMVDITNCDKDTAGYPDKLFLKGDSAGNSNRYSINMGSISTSYQYDSITQSVFFPVERTIHTSDYVKTSHVHQYGAWTKLNDTQHQRVCKTDSSHVEKANHTWDAGKVTKAATETAEGVKTYTCTVCKGTKTEAIPKISEVWTRLEGATRFDTMAKIIREGNFTKGGTVLIARGDDYRDALAASGLAGVLEAPIVLTLQKNLPNQSKDILKELNPKRVIIIGGENAIAESVKKQIFDACPNITDKESVDRCSGQYAIDTSAEIAREGKGKWKDGIAIIARTDDFKDALSAAPIAYAMKYPIILAYNGEVFDDNVLSAMKEIGIKEFVVVGGKNAVKPKAVETLKKNGFSMKQRLEGQWAVHTSGEIAEWGISLGMTADKMGVATPMNYPDALAGAALCGKNNSVMVLLNDSLPQNLEFIKKYKHSISKGYVFGGTSVVGTKTFGELEKIK